MTKRDRRCLSRPVAFIIVLSLLFGVSMAAGQRRRPAAAVPAPGPANFTDPALVGRYRQLITPRSLAERLYFLASDNFEGRETATQGQKLAARYLASQYRQLGLAPKGNEKAGGRLSAYLQPFNVYKRVPKRTRLELLNQDRRLALSLFSADSSDDLSYFSGGGFGGGSGGVVFAGYGIADDKLDYDDYAALAAKGISINDKWVLILDGEPLADSSTSLLPTPDHKPSSWTRQFINKRRAVWNAGRPRGVLVVAEDAPGKDNNFRDRAAQAALNTRSVGYLSLSPTSDFPPTYSISTRLANQILGSAANGIGDLKRQIDSGLKPVVFRLEDQIRIASSIERFPPLSTENVLAFIEGSDPKLKHEVVIVSAHYDHLGLDPRLKGDQIFNGAADDGSGVVATLAMAQQFMKASREGFGPRRSLLFINFSGEEKGLLGSAYYTMRQPAVPWENVVAEINMDGVAGLDAKHPTGSKNYIFTLGTEALSRELLETTKRLNGSTGINLELTEGPRFSSDQYNFETQLVPYIYFSTGLTEHYHQVSDEPTTIDYDHMSRVVQLIFATAWQVANQDERPTKVDRSQLTLVGYVCPPCPFECDGQVYDHPGECPVCRMTLEPKYIVGKRSASASSGGPPALALP